MTPVLSHTLAFLTECVVAKDVHFHMPVRVHWDFAPTDLEDAGSAQAFCSVPVFAHALYPYR